MEYSIASDGTSVPRGFSDSADLSRSFSIASPAGESSLRDSEMLTVRRSVRGDGVLAGDDFCGEIDLARSFG